MRIDQRYTARLPLPDLIVRGRAHVLECPVYRTGALVTPSSGTVSLYDPTETAVVSAASVTITSSVATYSLSSGTLSAYNYSEGWRVEWSLTLPDGAIVSPRNDASLCRNGLWPVITDSDLVRRCAALDPNAASGITSAASYQYAIDEAWTEIQLSLIAKGNRPNLIMEPSALRTAHLFLALSIVFENEQTRLSGAWTDRAVDYRAQYKQAWDSLSFRYATDDASAADMSRKAARPITWLASRR
jgi:hypothetical protein